MNIPATLSIQNIPALIDRATRMLSEARTSGEVLEVRDYARVAYDAAKSAGRMARTKKAHDDVLAAAYRMQADALLIESRAKARLADEYDAAQERGEVAGHGGGRNFNVGVRNVETTAAELGLRRDEIHEARQIRDAELAHPGLVERILSDRADRGLEPTKAALREAVEAVNKPFVTQNSGNNEWYTPVTYIDAARHVMGRVDLDPASSEIANQTVGAKTFYTADDDGLTQSWARGTIWMNPPYSSNLIGKFASKFAAAVRDGSEGIVLVNNGTETGWFQELASNCSAICFPKSRIKFLDTEGNASNAPLQGQAILYCGPHLAKFLDVFSQFGLVVIIG